MSSPSSPRDLAYQLQNTLEALRQRRKLLEILQRHPNPSENMAEQFAILGWEPTLTIEKLQRDINRLDDDAEVFVRALVVKLSRV
jgi:hypothetical protein